MLFGFVRTNSKEYTPADETRWGDTALSLLEEALQLLREVNVDRNEPRLSDQETRASRLFDECWPYVELGVSRSGHWAVLDKLGRVDFDRLNRELGPNQVLQCYAQRMERVRRSKLRLAEAQGTQAYYHTTILDLRGLNAAFLRQSNRAFIQRTFKFSSTCYPETVFRIYIINCPAAFPLAWKAIRPWCDPETSHKIQVLSKDAGGKIRERLGFDLDAMG